MTRRRHLIILIVLALLTACSGGKGKSAAETTSSTAKSTTSSTTSTTATTAAETTCAAKPIPTDAADVQTAEADVDGAQGSDTVTLYRVGKSDAPEWHLRVDLAKRGSSDAQLGGEGFGFGGVALVGGADIDGDGTAELWVKVGAGASADILGLYRFADCKLTAVQLNGSAATVAIGGSVGQTSGVDCADENKDGTGDLVVLSATSSDGTTYATTTRVYALAAGALTETTSRNGTIAASDPAFQRFTSFRCNGLSL